jgi:hypothetical protein
MTKREGHELAAVLKKLVLYHERETKLTYRVAKAAVAWERVATSKVCLSDAVRALARLADAVRALNKQRAKNPTKEAA